MSKPSETHGHYVDHDQQEGTTPDPAEPAGSYTDTGDHRLGEVHPGSYTDTDVPDDAAAADPEEPGHYVDRDA